MATVHTPVLTLVSHNHDKRTATVKVEYTLHQSTVERNLVGLQFRETIQLWGSDSPDPDDFLFSFATTFYASVQGNVHIDRSRSVTLGDDVLDEDGFPRPTDEVYARVCVTPMMPTADCKNSNQIEHRF